MEPILIAATVTALVTLFVSFKEEIFAALSFSGNRNISGLWEGKAKDVEYDGVLEYEIPLTYKIQCRIHQRGKLIRGEAWIDSDMQNHINFKGKMVKDDYYSGEYKNTDKKTHDAGVFVMHLLGTGSNVVGHFAGIRMREHGVVVSKVNMKKLS